jgi:DNA-binding CsgD family transcriptional regulator
MNQIDKLTNTERMIGRLVAMGMTNQAIANHLVITLGTIESHTHHLRAKLGIKGNRCALALKLRELGIETLPYRTTYRQKITFLSYKGMNPQEIAQKIGCCQSYARACSNETINLTIY